MMGNSRNLLLFNFTILLKSRKFDAGEIYVFYSMSVSLSTVCFHASFFLHLAKCTCVNVVLGPLQMHSMMVMMTVTMTMIYHLCQGVFPVIFLSFCLLPTSHNENDWSDLRENFTGDASVDKKEPIKFWKSSVSVSRSWKFFKGFVRIARRAFFHNLARISRKSDQI